MSESIQLSNAGIILSNIGNELIKNKNLMRCIKYDTENALSQPEVDIDEILNLCGLNPNKELRNEQQRIYKYPFTNKILDIPKTELRFFVPSVKPDDIYLAELYVNFQIVVHNSIIELDDNKLRYWVMVEEILKTLNANSVGGVGLFYLKTPISIVPWSDYYSGYTFNMCTRTV